MLEGADRFSTLARLLRFGVAMPCEEAAAALAPARLRDAVAAGLLVAEGDQVRAPFSLVPYADLLLVSDRPQRIDTPADVVAPVSPAAVSTARLTPRRPVDSTLDLGTGCGIQALCAAAHSTSVVGVDVSPRALAFARLNAAFNEIPNVSWIEGDWLEPVQGRRFDLIVANPPYVIGPDTELLYRDSGMPPGALAQRLIAELPDHLELGGLAQVMLSWVQPTNGDWAEPVRSWVEPGCDALIFRFGVDDQIAYAAGWNASLLKESPSHFERGFERWLAYQRELGIDAVAWGAVILRRRSDGPNWIRAVDVAGAPTGPAGEHVLRLLEAHDRLSKVDESKLLDEVLALVPGHRIDQTLTYPDGRYHSHPAIVRLSPGLEVRVSIDPDALDTIFRCDGTRSLRELIDKPERKTAVCFAARELLSAGLIVAAPDREL